MIVQQEQVFFTKEMAREAYRDGYCWGKHHIKLSKAEYTRKAWQSSCQIVEPLVAATFYRGTQQARADVDYLNAIHAEY